MEILSFCLLATTSTSSLTKRVDNHQKHRRHRYWYEWLCGWRTSPQLGSSDDKLRVHRRQCILKTHRIPYDISIGCSEAMGRRKSLIQLLEPVELGKRSENLLLVLKGRLRLFGIGGLGRPATASGRCSRYLLLPLLEHGCLLYNVYIAVVGTLAFSPGDSIRYFFGAPGLRQWN